MNDKQVMSTACKLENASTYIASDTCKPMTILSKHSRRKTNQSRTGFSQAENFVLHWLAPESTSSMAVWSPMLHCRIASARYKCDNFTPRSSSESCFSLADLEWKISVWHECSDENSGSFSKIPSRICQQLPKSQARDYALRHAAFWS